MAAPSGCLFATIKLYPSPTKSSVIRSRDYRHVLKLVIGIWLLFHSGR
jgi:hypothetical protein